MKRFRRGLFNFAAAVSVVMWVAAVILWVRSYWRADFLFCETNGTDVSPHANVPAETAICYAIASGSGGLGIARIRTNVLSNQPPVGGKWQVAPTPLYPAAESMIHYMLVLDPARTQRAFDTLGVPYRTFDPAAVGYIVSLAQARRDLQDSLAIVLANVTKPSARSPFSIYHANTTGVSRDDIRVIIVPYWTLFVAVGLPVIIFVMFEVRGFNRRKRMTQGRCAICGYDLRATPDRCPECGTMPLKIARSNVAARRYVRQICYVMNNVADDIIHICITHEVDCFF